MCIRCLRNVNDDDIDKLGEDNFSIAGTEDGDNQSLISNEMAAKTFHSAVSFQVSERNFFVVPLASFCSCFYCLNFYFRCMRYIGVGLYSIIVALTCNCVRGMLPLKIVIRKTGNLYIKITNSLNFLRI